LNGGERYPETGLWVRRGHLVTVPSDPVTLAEVRQKLHYSALAGFPGASSNHRQITSNLSKLSLDFDIAPA